MTLLRCSIIYTIGSDATERRVERVGSAGCVLITVGVTSPADVANAVHLLIDEENVQLIELCGAFGPAETQAALEAAAGRVPVGAVTYPCSEATGLHTLFG